MEDEPLNMETDPPDKTTESSTGAYPGLDKDAMYEQIIAKGPDRLTPTDVEFLMRNTQPAAPDNKKRRKQKDLEKSPSDHPPTVPDLDRCRQHKELKKDINMMNGRLAFLEHCICSEKEIPDLTNDATLAAYQKDYDGLVSLKERKVSELVLFLPCPELDCPDNVLNSNNVNDLSKNNVKKHARKASQKNSATSPNLTMVSPPPRKGN
ncbi:hypothetical protein TNCV_3688681 [Trichonephila clavipes]|nr:hypothetical protein TNCV_3688681 [Trichonephila clavipes]